MLGRCSTGEFVASTWFNRLTIAAITVAATTLSARTLDAALTNAPEPRKPPSLAGQLLVATPEMGDPRFARTVILMVRHDQSGAFGIVINRPLGEAPLANLLRAIGDKDTSTTENIRILAGGPVQPEVCVVVHSAEYRQPGTIGIDGKIAVTTTPDVLRDIASRRGPQKTLVALGYAGWAAGQLEDELKRNAWYLASQDPALVFDDDRDKVWEHAVARRTQDL
jgi:putative transcriptional regulator